MMGLSEAAGSDADETPTSWARRYFVELPRLIKLLARSTVNFWRIRSLVDEFMADFDAHYEKWSQVDFASKRPHELMSIYRRMEADFLFNWETPIINDFYVMVFSGVLGRLCASWCGDETGALSSRLLGAHGEVASLEPARRIMDLARIVRNDPALAGAFTDGTPVALASSLPADDRFATFNAAMASYLRDFGCRCPNELKLEEPSLDERPALAYKAVKDLVMRGGAARGEPAGAPTDARAEAEEALRAAGGGVIRRRVFLRMLARARQGIADRERMRLARSRIYGLVRRLLVSIGSSFAGGGIIDSPDDIFYLTMDETWDYIKGTSVTHDLRTLIAMRRREYASYRDDAASAPADRFETFGVAYHRNSLRGTTGTVVRESDGSLKGVPCSAGRVRAPAVVIDDPADAPDVCGKIIVARRTDPGWVMLYPSAAGIVVERGSVLSHAAVVAREMGLPAVVGVPGLVASVATGDILDFDGRTGHVTVLPPDPPALAAG
jgi:pyruvate,water dikinase